MNRYQLNLMNVIPAVLLALLVTAPEITANYKFQGNGQSLTREDLIALFLDHPSMRGDPQRAMNEIVRPDKIAFVPTKLVCDQLIRDGVPKVVADELKHLFAARIIYRVAKFEPNDAFSKTFTETLVDEVQSAKTRIRVPGSLLAEKGFDPNPSESAGPSIDELRQFPGIGYIVILGKVVGHGTTKSVTAHLVYMSERQHRMEIVSPIPPQSMDASSDSQKRAAKTIAEWSINSLIESIQ
jgi:hypothetical protein